jgi:hypothetical protein
MAGFQPEKYSVERYYAVVTKKYLDLFGMHA